ncbi:MAG TPA: DinB family protein [Terriglobales bacterium]|nr:DinB family protein [Terriglobales bacterium]
MRIFLTLMMLSTALWAQSAKDPVTSAVKEILPRQQKNLIAAAEEMPADKYAYKPTPEQITFGHLIMHIAGSNNSLCGKIGDVAAPKADELKEMDGKDKLVAALKGSFDFCEGVLAKADDSKLGDGMELWKGHQGTRASALIALSNDWADHYSAAAMYLRLNGMLPPSAQGKK